MEILYLLVPLSVFLVFLVGALFWWSLQSGQFDDLEGPAGLIFDESAEEALAAPHPGSGTPPPA